MQTTRYIAMNTFFGILLYFGFYQHVEGAKNVALFFTWFAIIGSVIMIGSSDEEKLAHGLKGRSAPWFIDVVIDIAIITVFILFDYWITATFYFISCMLMSLYWEQTKKLVEKSKSNTKDEYTFFPPQ